MIAGLCHDLDHPGYSNTFIKLSKHPLAVLYDASFLENHHYWMGQCLLQVFFTYLKQDNFFNHIDLEIQPFSETFNGPTNRTYETLSPEHNGNGFECASPT